MRKILILALSAFIISGCASTSDTNVNDKLLEMNVDVKSPQQVDAVVYRILDSSWSKFKPSCTDINKNPILTIKEEQSPFVEYFKSQVRGAVILYNMGEIYGKSLNEIKGYSDYHKKRDIRYQWIIDNAIKECSKDNNQLFIKAIEISQIKSRTVK